MAASSIFCCDSNERVNSTSAEQPGICGCCQRIWDAVREFFTSLLCCSSEKYDFSTVTGYPHHISRERIPPSGIETYMPLSQDSEDSYLSSRNLGGELGEEEYFSEESDLDEPITGSYSSDNQQPTIHSRNVRVRPTITAGTFNRSLRDSQGAEDPSWDIYSGQLATSHGRGMACLTNSGRALPLYIRRDGREKNQ